MRYAAVKLTGWTGFAISHCEKLGTAADIGPYYVIVGQRFLWTKPHLTISLSRRHLRHVWLSGDDIKSLHMISKCCRWWCGCSQVCMGLANSRNVQFSRHVLHISLTEVVGRGPLSRLGELVKPHLLLPKALHSVLYCFGHCSHHPARFVILAQFAMPCILFIIILVFPILLIFATCKITQTVSHSIQHLLKCYFRLCGCQSSLFNITHMFLLTHYRCLCIFNSLSCHCGLLLHIILYAFLCLFFA